MKRIALVIILSLFAASATASACPNCRESVETPAQTDPDQDQTASTLSSGFNGAIWVMLGGLAGGLGLIGTTIVLVARREMPLSEG